MRTGTIKFNVTQRGRKHRGVDRNFDTAALASLINSGDVQERVKNRDLRGYFGHQIRSKFGWEPPETVIYEGKQVTLEPAMITTKLTAMPDGTVEHEAEFLDTPPGRTAKRLFSSKSGGFSSVIAVRELGGRDVPIAFHGFDYVTEPNFTTNRGYALDSVGAPAAAAVVMDDAMRESQATLAVLDGLYSQLQGDFDMQAQALARLAAENAVLVDMLAKGSMDPAKAKAVLSRMDSTTFELPGRTTVLDSASLSRMAREFETLELAGFETPKASPETSETRKLGNLVSTFFENLRR
jgi:hypothetical protein